MTGPNGATSATASATAGRARALLTGDVLMAVAFLVLMVVSVVGAEEFRTEARIGPLLIGIPTLVLSVINVIRCVRTALQAAGQPATSRPGTQPSVDEVTMDDAVEAASTSGDAGPHSLGDELRPFLWLAAYLAVLFTFGIVVATTVISAALVWREAHLTPARAALFGLGSGAVFYLLLQTLLGFRLYTGLLLGVAAIPPLPGVVG